MKIATSAYPLDFLTSWAEYEDKIARWVDEAVQNGANVLLFPEYAAMELATLAGRDVALDLEASLFAVSDRLAEADALHARLAQEYGVYIVAGSGPATQNVPEGVTRPVNRARFFGPTGMRAEQDKQIMTRFEAEEWGIAPGGPLRMFETDLGKIGVLICYDSEFPLLGRALAEADVILIPSVTEAVFGYSRVRIGAQARALENQCVTAMASVVGDVDWSEAVDVSVGAGGVYGPPDRGFPDTGVIAQGALNTPGWTYAEINVQQIKSVREDGGVLNRRDWDYQNGRDGSVTITPLCANKA